MVCSLVRVDLFLCWLPYPQRELWKEVRKHVPHPYQRDHGMKREVVPEPPVVFVTRNPARGPLSSHATSPVFWSAGPTSRSAAPVVASLTILQQNTAKRPTTGKTCTFLLHFSSLCVFFCMISLVCLLKDVIISVPQVFFPGCGAFF